MVLAAPGELPAELAVEVVMAAGQEEVPAAVARPETPW